MEHLFIPYKQALALKEVGFKEKCLSAYRSTDEEESLMGFSLWKNGEIYDNHNGFCAAPTWNQTFDWFRKEYDLDSSVAIVGSHKYRYYIYKNRSHYFNLDSEFFSYEEAQQELLEKLIEVIK